MTDNNPWRTFLTRRAHGMREPQAAPVITPEQHEEGWLRAVDNIEREMKRLKVIPADEEAPVPPAGSALPSPTVE